MSAPRTVGLLSPGDMGHVVAQRLRENGLRVISCLEGRSARTRRLAASAGVEAVADDATLVAEADLILSILVPAQAAATAARVAAALRSTGAAVVYADCNAIAPLTMRAIDETIRTAGSVCIDASIIGPPPRTPGRTRFYASGPDTAMVAALNDYGLDVRVIGAEIGAASALKMCYAALTKGSAALMLTLLTAAERLGVADALQAEFALSQEVRWASMQHLGRVPAKARRWVGEMEEIAITFAGAGLAPDMGSGAAAIFDLLGATALADRNPEDESPPPTLAELLAVLA